MFDTFSRLMSAFSTQSVIRKNTLLTLSRQMLAAVIQLLTVIIIARQLGPEGNGLYAMAILLPSMLVTFLNFGVGPATVFYIGRGELSPELALRANLSLGTKVILLTILCVLPLVYVFGEQVFPSVPISLLMLGFVIFPVSLLLSYGISVLQGQEDFKRFNLITLISPTVTLLMSVFSLIVFDLGVFSVVVAYLIGQVVGLFLLFISTRVNYSGKYTGSAPEQKKLLRYGWKAHFGNIMAFVNYRADIFLVNFLIGPVATGIYVIAVQFAEKLWMLSQAASIVLLPRLSSMSDEVGRRHQLSLRAGWITGVLTFIASLLLIVLLYFFLEPIFGSEYQPAFVPFLWLLPGIVLGATSRIYSNTIAAAGKPEWNMYASILVVTVNVAGNLILIPELGLKGAAIATSIAYSLNFLLKLVMISMFRVSQPK